MFFCQQKSQITCRIEHRPVVFDGVMNEQLSFGIEGDIRDNTSLIFYYQTVL